jgi:hypothetical protein
MKTYFVLFIVLLLFLFADKVQGQLTFQKSLGGPLSEYGRSMLQTPDGGYLIVGPTTSFGDTGHINAYIIKTDANGDTLWTRAYSDTADIYPYCLSGTKDKGYIIRGTSNAKHDGFLLKISMTGSLLWYKVIGGTNVDALYGCFATASGNYIATGKTLSLSGGYDVFVVKTDPAGNIIWSKAYGGIYSDIGWSIKETSAGDYILCGSTQSFGIGGLYVVRLDTSGIPAWSCNYGDGSAEEAVDIIETSDHNFMVAGNTVNHGAGSNEIVLMKISSAGAPLWAKTYGGSSVDKCSKVIQTSDNGFLLTGYTTSFGAGSMDAYVIKTDSLGNLLWSHAYGGTGSELGYCLLQTMDGNYAMLGSETSMGNGGIDVYLLKMNSSGYTGCTENNAATVMTSWNIPVNVPVINALNVGSAISPSLQAAYGGVVFSNCINLEAGAPAVQENEIQLYPNPSNEKITIKSDAGDILYLHIENILGKNILFRTVRNKISTLDISNLDNGNYIVKVLLSDKMEVQKKLTVIH